MEMGTQPAHSMITDEVAFGYPRDFLENQFVYLVISPRAGGLSIGVNVNPIVNCNFQCLYCEVDRAKPARVPHFDVERMAAELRGTLGLASSGRLRQRPRYANLPDDLLQVRHVALSGDGEPTLSSHFVEALQAIAHLRVLGGIPLFQDRGCHQFNRTGSAKSPTRIKVPRANGRDLGKTGWRHTGLSEQSSTARRSRWKKSWAISCW